MGGMGYYSRSAIGDLFGDLLNLFMERPLIGGLLIAAVLAFFWLILPELEREYYERYYSRPTEERMEYKIKTVGAILAIVAIVVIISAMQ